MAGARARARPAWGGAHAPRLAFGVRLVELAEPNRHVAADDDRTPASLDDDHLHAAGVARRRDESEPGKQLELAVDRHVTHAGRLDPLGSCVVILAARVVELPTLEVSRSRFCSRPIETAWLH